MKKAFTKTMVLTLILSLLASPISIGVEVIQEVAKYAENTDVASEPVTKKQDQMPKPVEQATTKVDNSISSKTEQEIENEDGKITKEEEDICVDEPVKETDAPKNDISNKEEKKEGEQTNQETSSENKEVLPTEGLDETTSDSEEMKQQDEIQDTSETVKPNEEATLEEENSTKQQKEEVTTNVAPEEQNGLLKQQETQQENKAQPQEEIPQEEMNNFVGQPLEKQTITLGKLELEIILRLPTQANFKVTLQKDTNTIIGQFEKDEDRCYYHFDGLEEGKYTLTIQGQNYIPYSQQVEVKGDVTKIVLSNGHEINDVYKNNQTPYGIVGLGDINEDAQINKVDETLMIAKIEQGDYEAKYDLNHDNKIDIIDLSYIALNRNNNIKGTQQKMLKLTKENVTLQTGTIITKGDVSSIFENNNEILQLQPKNGNPISIDNPVTLEVDLKNNQNKTEAIVIAPPKEQTNTVQKGEVEVVYQDENGTEHTIKVKIGNTEIATQIEAISSKKLASISPTFVARTKTRKSVATLQKDGSILIDLGGQIAIKRVTIKITQTTSNKLADIAKVEFLNDMESKIPEPEMDIPENVVATPLSASFNVTWKKMVNITGYEIEVSSNGKTQTYYTAVNQIMISNFDGGKVKNGTTYTVKVQSINGDWKSGYSKTISVTPQADKKPPAPDNLSVSGGYRMLQASWKKMEDTDSYNVYYREYGVGNYIKIAQNITENTYKLTELKDKTRYQVYVTGNNPIGEGSPSLVSVGETTDINPPITSNYKLINRPIENEAKTAHIANVSYPGGSAPSGQFAIVDNDYTTAWKINSWDSGGFNSGSVAPIVEFDQTYQIERIVVVAEEAQEHDYFYQKTRYWDENGTEHMINGQCTKKTSSNGKQYYEFEYDMPITTKKIQIRFALYQAYSNVSISIAEMKFYEYDDIKEQITGLYKDQLCVTLREDVTEETINALETRLNTKEEISGEYHPKREILQKELDTAREILNNQTLKPALQIDTSVTSAKDSHITFRGGLNAWQPLGVVGYSGENIVVYVGNPKMKTGDTTKLQIIATQYHAESGKWHQTIKTLKVGRNEIQIPQIGTLDYEKGGSLYINYTGNNANDIYGVRVSGGQEIPVLDFTKPKTEAEKKQAILTYIEKLETTVATLPENHNKLHKGNESNSINYDYQNTNCILGATEIVLSTMMYSVSSEQIWNALSGTKEEKVEKLYQSLVAMEDMIDLFYAHKGLSRQIEAGAKNQYPSSRLNIRYQRMFAGAFMYAGGLHIGIEWGSIGGLATSQPVQSDENGKYQSGQYFGWGIAHEIGHIINEGTYAIAEVTNNYFSVLAQAKDTNDSVRFQYRNVYDKVTSGTKGKASNVFTQLAMYWQLHLAYDLGGYNYKTYDTYQEQFNNLIFARIDSYARDISKAPAKEIALTLNNADTDNRFMRLAITAANKNILEFFEAWGMVPDETTRQYAQQFEKETRRIQFVNDEARAYQLQGNTGFPTGAKPTAHIENTMTNSVVKDTKIRITLGLEGANKNDLLGYEIYRNGVSIGFVTAENTEFVDTINVNNRVYQYEIAAIDKTLQSTEKVSLAPIKVCHDGSLEKTAFTITTNMTSNEDTKEEEDKNCADMPSVQAVSKLINNNIEDSYTGTTQVAKNAEIVLELNEVLSIIGFKVTKANTEDNLPDYELQISQDKKNWETVKQGSLTFNQKEAVVYFDKDKGGADARVQVYDTAYVKLIFKNTTKQEMNITLSEIDLLGKPGDNIEILQANGIGTLKEDYILDNIGNKIPAGSFIVTGEYRGHPAFNVVKLYDENGNLIEGKQVIFAPDPENADLGNITSGTWIYYIEPEEINKLPTKVKAELYRVDNALTLEGERLVSDSLEQEVPQTLPDITINQGNP